MATKVQKIHIYSTFISDDFFSISKHLNIKREKKIVLSINNFLILTQVI